MLKPVKVQPFKAGNARFAIVASQYNGSYVDAMVQAAAAELEAAGARTVQVVRVPGAFEIPLAAKKLAASGTYHGVVCLGAVIRGATPHFDYVANECVKGLAQVMLDTNVPVGFGVLTVDTLEL